MAGELMDWNVDGLLSVICIQASLLVEMEAGPGTNGDIPGCSARVRLLIDCSGKIRD
jgi:hypothetical protein